VIVLLLLLSAFDLASIKPHCGARSRHQAGGFAILQWTPDSAAAALPDDAAPSLSTALREQLGIKMESGKARLMSSSSITSRNRARISSEQPTFSFERRLSNRFAPIVTGA
jgi:hypothetical protein